jgi:hypothetical protein
MSVSARPGRTAGGRADDDRDLRDRAPGARHDLEGSTNGVQRDQVLDEPGATGVPDTHDRHLLAQGSLVGQQDHLAALRAHGTALNHGVRGESHHGSSAHLTHPQGTPLASSAVISSRVSWSKNVSSRLIGLRGHSSWRSWPGCGNGLFGCGAEHPRGHQMLRIVNARL